MIVKDFLSKLESAYTTAGVYIQKKYAIDNQLLVCLTALDPIIRGHTATHSHLLKLLPYFKFTCSPENNNYSAEISSYQIDKDLPVVTVGDRLDVWWSSLFKSNKYPCLSKVVKAALSIFTGPQVETSFSMMNDIIDKRSSRMDITTYSAIMKVKFGLLADGQSSFKKFHRRNILRDPVDKVLAYNMRTARSRYVKRLSEKRELISKKKKLYKITESNKKSRKIKRKSKHSKIHARVRTSYFLN